MAFCSRLAQVSFWLILAWILLVNCHWATAMRKTSTFSFSSRAVTAIVSVQLRGDEKLHLDSRSEHQVNLLEGKISSVWRAVSEEWANWLLQDLWNQTLIYLMKKPVWRKEVAHVFIRKRMSNKNEPHLFLVIIFIIKVQLLLGMYWKAEILTFYKWTGYRPNLTIYIKNCFGSDKLTSPLILRQFLHVLHDKCILMWRGW